MKITTVIYDLLSDRDNRCVANKVDELKMGDRLRGTDAGIKGACISAVA
jgi:hypothetical protein